MEKPKKFVGLHGHSTFSTFDGLGYPQEHIDFAHENGMDAIALTDHGNMNGYCFGFLHEKKMQDAGKKFKFIGGVEAYYHPDLAQWERDRDAARQAKLDAKEAKKRVVRDDLESGLSEDESMVIENEDESKDVSKWFNPVNRRHHLVLLPKSRKGLENIFALVSRSYQEGFYKFPRLDRKMLKTHSEGVIATTACIGGPVAFAVFSHFKGIPFDQLTPSLIDDPSIMEKVVNSVANVIGELQEVLGKENVFPEIQFNKLSSQHLVNRAILEFAKRTRTPIIATADAHYCRPEFWQAREMYKKLGWLGYENITPESLPKNIEDLKCELYPKNADQMWSTYKTVSSHYSFYDDVQIAEAIENTWHIAHDVIGDVKPNTSDKLPSYIVEPNLNPLNVLVEAVKEGLIRKGLHKNPIYIARAKEELEVIKFKKFELYFLTMKAIFDIASNVCLVGPGRGSSSGSLVNYCLGITQIDPIKHDLLFARFLTRLRMEAPDIDCLASHHLVKMGDGTIREMSTLNVGEDVIDMNGEKKCITHVKHRSSTNNDVIIQFTISIEGTFGTIVCNHKHRLFVKDQELIVKEACNIKVGDVLSSHDGFVIVHDKKTLCDRINLTDITVKDSSSFCVIPFDVLVVDTQNEHICDKTLVCINRYIDEDFKDVVQQIISK